ncbi:unnamed protein product [Closterium sp. NIES-54]
MGRTRSPPPIDTSTATFPLLNEVDEPADEDVEEAPPCPPPPVRAAPPRVADLLGSTLLLTIGDERSLEALLVARASGIVGGRRAAKIFDRGVKPSTTGDRQTGELMAKEAAQVPQTGEQQTRKLTGELPDKGQTPTKQLVDEYVDDEGELSAREESTDNDVVEVPVEKPELRGSGRNRKPPERST